MGLLIKLCSLIIVTGFRFIVAGARLPFDLLANDAANPVFHFELVGILGLPDFPRWIEPNNGGFVVDGCRTSSLSHCGSLFSSWSYVQDKLGYWA